MKMDVLCKIVLFLVVLFALAFFPTNAQNNGSTPSPGPETCANHTNSDCDTCTGALGGDQCFWCDSDKMCREWRWGRSHVLPTGTDCGGYNWNYRSCSLNGVAYAVIISVVLFVVLIIITCVVICCCVWCARRKKRNWRRHQEKYEDERREINERSAQRRAERKTRTDEIRRKYGLDKGEHDSKYEKFV